MWEVALIGLGFLFLILIQLVYNCSCLFAKFNVWRVKNYYGVKHPKLHQQNYGKWSSFTLPIVGEMMKGDFRTGPSARSPNLRIVSWNIELGYKLGQIIERLQQLQPDILLLQECDCVMDSRGLNVHAAEEIARQLQMSFVWCGAFGYEFPHGGKGLFGNAILSKFPLIEPQRVLINEVIPGYPKSVLKATVVHPQGNIMCYSVHLEAVTGIRERSKQFVQVLKDWEASFSPSLRACVIAGDLNTLGHNASRISPVHCRDSYRCTTWGLTEAEWFQQHFFEAGRQGFGFTDPFHKNKDHTLRNGLISAKFDWVLLNGLRATRKHIGTGQESDHWFVLVDTELAESIVPPISRF